METSKLGIETQTNGVIFPPRASSRMENRMLLLYQFLQARGNVLTAMKVEENGMRLTGLPSASYFRLMYI